ncbi:SAM-dependent methyltransferase [Amycolatopsis sp. CA-230715]|uniref:SAM-dependent methyltransferase n=1 Tax=Amycolatopsis sp. CA-230715 TaxID=2745196 RepID=UPI001C015614|nr:SAM-dependent methyltransferase [Amycolatopsis sp. CA-230715]QWF81333.1 Putative S-adenosyl-L-methionine-dependent methyltransferase [Amycolatopsis sp. CA-230715]
MTETSLPPVGRTAVGVAGLRAQEQLRQDKLFDDPYSAALFEAGRARVAAAGPPTAQRQAFGQLFATQVVIRTRFYDDYLLGSGCTQVVLLAAGLDARAFRLAWPDGTRLFEVDFPEVLGFKGSVLTEQRAEPRCERVEVPADLREDWASALGDAGFDPAAPTAWLAEGLLIYLTRDEAAALLTTVTGLSAPGSRISFEHRPDPDGTGLAALARAHHAGKHVTGLWKGGFGGDGPEWLSARGWAVTVHDREELADAYGRPVDEASGVGFLTATRS